MKNKTFTLLILLFFYSLSSKSQEPYYWHLSSKNGLPNVTIYKMLQDENNLIWIATANGLCNFDGKSFIKTNTSILNDQEILKIQLGSDGNIWGLNLSGQLFKIVNGNIEIINNSFGEYVHRVTDFEWFDNKLYLVNRISNSKNNIEDQSVNRVGSYEVLVYENEKNSLKRLENESINNNSKIKPSVLIRIFVDESKENFAIVCHNYEEADIYVLRKNSSTIDNHYFTLPFPEQKQLVFLSFWDKKIFFRKFLSTYYFDLSNQKTSLISSEKIITMSNSNDNLFAMKPLGLIKINKDFRIETIFSNQSVNHTLVDKEKNLWIGTADNGIFIVPNLACKIYHKYNSKISSNEIFSISKIDEKQLLIGKNNSTYSIFNNNGLNTFPIDYKGRILCVLKNNKEIIIGGDNGISLIKGKKVIKTSLIGAIKTIFKSKNNTIYLGTGLYFGKLENEKKHTLLSYLKTYAIGESQDGIIWVGTAKGIYYYNGKEVIKSEIPELQNVRTSAMIADKTGKLWICTQGQGVFFIKDNKLEKIYNQSNYFETSNFNCAFTEGNFVWLGSDNGIYRYDIDNNKFDHINKYFGLPTNEILSLAVLNKDLIVGTAKGLVQLPIDIISPNLIKPKIQLNQLLINEKEFSINNNTINLSYNENTIFISYISHQYRTHGNVLYEYRILELDTNWIRTEERNLRFANMKAGNYTIEIRAKNDNNIPSDSILLLFHISKPFWQQLWFYLALLILTGSGIAIFLNRRYSIQLTMEDLKMKALQAQMNPHFIFNSLNAIQHFLTTNDEENAVRYLSKFAKLIRIVFEYNKKTDITFAEELEMLNVYLTLEKLRFKDKIEVHIQISDFVEENKDNIFIPPLLIQPIIENAFKHGLFHKQEKGNLWINFDFIDNKFLKCVIKDDGIGREAVQKINNWRKNHSSSGINSTFERIKFRHRKNNVKIDNFFVIEDVIEHGEAKGTSITLLI